MKCHKSCHVTPCTVVKKDLCQKPMTCLLKDECYERIDAQIFLRTYYFWILNTGAMFNYPRKTLSPFAF